MFSLTNKLFNYASKGLTWLSSYIFPDLVQLSKILFNNVSSHALGLINGTNTLEHLEWVTNILDNMNPLIALMVRSVLIVVVVAGIKMVHPKICIMYILFTSY